MSNDEADDFFNETMLSLDDERWDWTAELDALATRAYVINACSTGHDHQICMQVVSSGPVEVSK